MSLEEVLNIIIQKIVSDPLGLALQFMTISVSLLTAWLLSRKGLERYGYLIGFSTLPLWFIQEAHYQQWFYLIINPVYLIMWWKGLKNHWRKNEKPTS